MPVEEAHHVERDAQHAVVLADREDRRQANPVGRERELEPRLAHHVVRRGRQRRPRRPAKHVPLVPSLDEEREVRAAAVPDPLDTQRSGAEAVRVEECLEPVEDDERWTREAPGLIGGADDVQRARHPPILPPSDATRHL